jgi:hypothetical protein
MAKKYRPGSVGIVRHGIDTFRKTGRIHPAITHRRGLIRTLNKVEDDMRAAAEDTIKNSILIDIARQQLGIIGLSGLYLGEHGLFLEGRLQAGKVEPQSIMKTLFAAWNSLRLTLDRIVWKKSDGSLTVEGIVARITAEKRKGKKR